MFDYIKLYQIVDNYQTVYCYLKEKITWILYFDPVHSLNAEYISNFRIKSIKAHFL